MNKKGTRALMPNHLKQIVASKHSAEMTISTLVVIVLAILVLVVLALGFGAGWSNLWSKITGFFSPVNVDSVKQACVFACTTEAKYDYCNRKRDVILQKDGTKDKETYAGDNAKTCKELENEANLGFEKCTNFDCGSNTQTPTTPPVGEGEIA